MVVRKSTGEPVKPSSTMRIIDMKVEDGAHKKIVLKLCKIGKFYEDDVYVRLCQEFPPSSVTVPEHLRSATMEIMKESFRKWPLHGLLAIDSTKTEQNPEGKDKVVGFVLYIIGENKNQLQVLFLFVVESYRKKFHASSMMKTVQARHLGDADSGEQINGIEKSKDGYDLVNFMTVEVRKDSSVIAFYRTLGFAVASEVPGWDRQVGQTTSSKLIIMVDAGPQTFLAIRDKGGAV